MRYYFAYIQHYLANFFINKPKCITIDNLIQIGTSYGGWTIPDNLLSSKSICYLVGAGEDISFDLGIAERYGCEIYIFDPTPRAKKHFHLVIDSIKENKKMSINNSKTDFYNLNYAKLGLLNYRELGLWFKEDDLKFFSPKNSNDVSHSAVNIQKTDKYFLAHVKRLSQIMAQENHKSIDLLKIDIEGAEYLVIESIIQDKCNIKILCVEFHKKSTFLGRYNQKLIKESVNKLNKNGFRLVNIDSQYNYPDQFIKSNTILLNA